jgi:hypothetical protein
MSVTINASTSSGLVQTADTSGTLELQSNGTTKLSVLSTGVSGVITQGTAVASTSGTSIDFTGIPSWVKRITVLFNGVSTNGSSFLRIQIGSGSVDTTGYASTNGTIGPVSVSGASGGTAGWDIISNSSANTNSGSATLFLVSLNNWVFNSLTTMTTSVNTSIASGNKSALSGALDRVRITTVNGTDTFDAGTINILYEG